MGEMGHGPCDKQGDGFGWLRRAPSANFPRSSRGRRKAYFQSGSRVIEGSLTGGREEQGIECGTRLRTQKQRLERVSVKSDTVRSSVSL